MTLHVQDLGSGPAVLLLHAFPCDGRMWRPQADELVAAGRRVLIPDLPGFGDSPLPDAVPDLGLVASALLDWLDDAGVARCAIGGASLGGYIAMALMRARPELATALMFCGTKATEDSAAARENRERLARACLDAPDQTQRILEEKVLPGLVGETTRSTRPAVVEAVRGWLGGASADAVAWYQRAMAVRPDSLGTLAATDAPALVIFGAEDTLSPQPEQELMLGRLRQGREVRVPGVGHLVGVEAPARVAAELRGFLG